MLSNYIINQIKSSVPLADAVERYTGERLIKNKMRCPFHSERTASFTVYPKNNSYYCFGCGASGDVISFVQRYFNLSFIDTITRVDIDYNLRLLNATFSERRKAMKESRRQQEKQQRRRLEAERREAAYWDAFDKVLRYERIIKRYRPQSPSDEPSPEFTEALQNIAYAQYLLNCAENERRRINE